MRQRFLSVIIPCYNSGKYLPDALRSVHDYKNTNYEIIIVDDGSTDIETLNFLESINNHNYQILRQRNLGPAAARNTGARAAKGEFLLFLDSDNKIRADYIRKSIEVLLNDSEVGVVYANPNFFGLSTKPRFKPKEFDFASILFGNYIDMCAVVRKKAWEEVGGLDENRILFGHEDWDFWIMIGLKGWQFKYLDEILFDYRIREDSMLHYAQENERFNITKAYICHKHATPILVHYKKYYQQFSLFYKSPFRSFIKFFYFRYVLRKKYDPLKRN